MVDVVPTVLGILAGLAGALALAHWALRPRRLASAGRHVLVTGGSSGIGLACAGLLAERGALVTVAARSLPRLQAAEAEVRAVGGEGTRVQVQQMDVTDPAQVEAAVAAAEAAFGPVDMAICCAGACVPGKLEDLLPRDCELMARLNFLGPLYVCRALVPGMKARREGRLVLVSSQGGQTGVFGFTAYSGSKFALNGVAQSLQYELAPYGVRVGVSYPCDTDTPGFEQENKFKPIETHLMSEGGGAVATPEQIAGQIIAGMERGDFAITHGFEGFMLNLCTIGFGPSTSLLRTLLEVALLPVMRVVALFTVASFNRIARKHAPPPDAL